MEMLLLFFVGGYFTNIGLRYLLSTIFRSKSDKEVYRSSPNSERISGWKGFGEGYLSRLGYIWGSDNISGPDKLFATIIYPVWFLVQLFAAGFAVLFLYVEFIR